MTSAEPVVIDQSASAQFETVPIGIALGGGAARGFAHVPMVEAFDELGIRPQIIAGTSMGSIVGACWAGGMSGTELRSFACDLFDRRTQVLKRIVEKWPGSLGNLLNPMTPALVNAESLLEILLPDEVPRTFEALEIPFLVVATDFNTSQPHIMESGPLVSAIAASSALPALLKPVERDGRVLIDGGFVNPTPYDILFDRVPYTIAVDVTGVPKGGNDGVPGSMESIVGSTLIMLRTVMREKLENRRPDVLILPDVGDYRAMQFFKCDEILDAAGPSKEELKRALSTYLETLSRSA
ncbi:MAG: patatin-like phospholipase family protein [Pseudomonadota bacterium]